MSGDGRSTTELDDVPPSPAGTARPASPSGVGRRRFLAIAAGTAAGYALGSLIAYWWFDALGVGPSFYPPAGLTLALLVSLPRRDWPAVLAGAAAAEGGMGLAQGLGTLTVGYALANTVEPFVAASLIRGRVDRPDLRRRRDLMTFLAFGVVLGPIVGATIGATNYELLGEGGWIRFWLHWWIGDGLGVLVVGGTILAWLSPGGRRVTLADGLTTAAFVAAALALTAAEARLRSLAIAYLVVLLLGWTAFRLGTRGVALVGCALSFAVATAAAQGFDYTGLGYRPGLALAYLQTSIMLVLVGAFVLASEIHEREVATEGHSREHERLVAAEATARREHEIALALQRALLGPTSLVTDRATVACFYGAGVDDMQAGGDWHDVVRLDGGRLGLAVGDVLGRGLAAAAAMGQLRVALAALAPTEASPSALLDRLEAFATGIEGAEMATVLYGVLEPATGRFTYACAGHPPPLAIRPDGDVSFLWDGRSRPIGASKPSARRDGETRLDDGTTLVLYTDGLVERRGESLDVGLERLRAAAAAARGRPPEALRDVLVASLLPPGARADDVALVVVRLGEADDTSFRRRLPADPAALRSLRRELDAWLAGHDADEPTREAVVLAIWEAVVNGVEHGSEGPQDHVRLAVRLEGHAVVAEVSDAGRWRRRAPEPTRGNGLPLMRGSMDEVTVTTGETGTTVRLVRALERTGARR